MSSRATWTRATCIAVLAGFGFVAVRAADGDLPNTGMADPVALANAFDQFAAGGAPANIVILSLSNLRGVSSEAVNAGGRVQVNLATGLVTSVARLLPADGSFDLWLIDNQPGPARHDAGRLLGPPDASRNLHRAVGDGASGLRDAGACGLYRLLSRIGRSWSGRGKVLWTGSC